MMYLMSSFLLAASAAAEPLSVLDFGAKVVANCEVDSDSFDSTDAFQAALDAASTDPTREVFVPAGCFLMKANLQVPRGVTLAGSFGRIMSHTTGFGDTDLNDGTILLPTSSQNEPDADAFITLSKNSVLRGLTILYPDQVCSESAVPIPYPYSIDMVGENVAVTDVELLNSYNGIKAVNAPRHTITRVEGQPLNVGIYLDATYDIGRIVDAHFNPWYCQTKSFMKHQLTHGRAFVMGRSDWEYVLNTFAFGYAIGYHFIETDTGSMNGNFLGIGSDLSINASIQVDGLQPEGLLITNGEFTAFRNDDWLPGSIAQSHHLIVGEGNTGPIKFTNSAFWGPSRGIAKIEGSGTVGYSQCEFVEWAEQDGVDGEYAFRLNGTGSLSLLGNHFRQDKNQVWAEAGTRAIIANNIYEGALKNGGDGNILVDSNMSSDPKSHNWMTIGCTALVGAFTMAIMAIGLKVRALSAELASLKSIRDHESLKRPLLSSVETY